jgi:hypothetical protein
MIRVLILILILGGAIVAYRKNRSRKLSIKKLLVWELLYLVALILTIFPDLSNALAHLLGISRGADVMYFLSILVLFYCIFFLYVKTEKLSSTITELTINTSKALHDKEKKRIDNQETN